jgi:CRISPR-associated protein Csx17
MTTLHLHHLMGCAPAPLAHYLKALGILRVIAEQKDATVRGWWQDEHFCLLTILDRADLERFFLEEYAPTPFVSPWNKGSGFFSSRDPGMNPIETSNAARFEPFRQGISAARAPLAALAAADATVRQLKARTKAKKGMTAADKAAAKALKDDPIFKTELAAANKTFAALKADLFKPCEIGWRGPHRAWMDAAVVLPDEGKPSFPSLLGTGGNDGRVDFTNNAMQRIGDLFALSSADGHSLPAAHASLGDALWRAAGQGLVSAAIGQFLPGNAGGANTTTGPDGDSLINPWDFILMLEGTILFSARSTRRLDPTASSRASAPFAVRAHAIGHGSSGNEKAERGEQWMPLWARLSAASDLQAMLGEARAQLGRTTAHRPVDIARAVARLGITRGVTRFTRFGFLERNGQSNLAVPLGRVDVIQRPRTRLIDDLAPWLDRLQRLARDKHAPARLVHAERRFADAVFAVLTHDDSADRWQAVLLAAAAIEAIQVSGTAFKTGPIPALSPEWVTAANDGSVEWRLACALGSAAANYDRDGRQHDPVRHHWLPLEKGARRFREKDKRLVRDSRVVIGGRDAAVDLAAIIERRLIEAAQRGQRNVPLVAARGCGAHPADLAAIIAGNVDLDRISALSRAFMAVRWDRWKSVARPVVPSDARPDEAWIALRLVHLPWPLDEHRTIFADDAIIRRLMSGDGTAAVDIALRRLRASGLRPPIRGAAADAATSRLWAAALAFPISHHCAHTMARPFEPTSKQLNTQETQ